MADSVQADAMVAVSKVPIRGLNDRRRRLRFRMGGREAHMAND